MSEPSIQNPESLQPIVDIRQIATDISYAHWLHKMRMGMIDEGEEAKYKNPIPDDFTEAQATILVSDVMIWAFADPDGGLLPKAHLDTTRELLEKATSLVTELPNLDAHLVNNVVAEFDMHKQYCYTQYDASRGENDTGDKELFSEYRIAGFATEIMLDLIIPKNEGLKQAMFSGFVGAGWTKIFD